MRLTVNQLRRIIKEEVEAAVAGVPAKNAGVVDAHTREVAGDIAGIVGQGSAADYVSVARIVTDMLDHPERYTEEDDPVEMVADELGTVMMDSDGELDFDGLAMAQAICDEYLL